MATIIAFRDALQQAINELERQGMTTSDMQISAVLSWQSDHIYTEIDVENATLWISGDTPLEDSDELDSLDTDDT